MNNRFSKTQKITENHWFIAEMMDFWVDFNAQWRQNILNLSVWCMGLDFQCIKLNREAEITVYCLPWSSQQWARKKKKKRTNGDLSANSLSPHNCKPHQYYHLLINGRSLRCIYIFSRSHIAKYAPQRACMYEWESSDTPYSSQHGCMSKHRRGKMRRYDYFHTTLLMWMTDAARNCEQSAIHPSSADAEGVKPLILEVACVG